MRSGLTIGYTMELIMKAIALVDHLTESELAEKIRHEKDSSIRDRYRAILWIHQGESRGDIAKRLGIGCSTLYRWVKRYNSSGESGLHRQPGQGRKRTLTPERVENIKEWVNSEEGVWTLTEKGFLRLLRYGDSISITHEPETGGRGRYMCNPASHMV